MMFMPLMLLFTLILFISVFLVISSPSWLGAWVGLEVNLMSFIPLMLSRVVITSVESCVKYFLVQAFSSLLLLLSILTHMQSAFNLWTQFSFPVMLLVVALLIKLGAAPFHYWFPSVSSGIGWYQNFVLMTFQKVGPLVLLYYVWGLVPLTILLVMGSAFVGSVGGLNQSSMRKLMAYSSINHLGWLLVACYFGLKFMFTYFLIYLFTNLFLVGVMASSGIYYLSQIYYYASDGLKSILMMVTWFSFGGLPPFVGFFGKWLIISSMLDSGMLFLCFFLIMMSLVSLYYYTRVCYVVASQSSGMFINSSYETFGGWWFNFYVLILLTSLVGAPMFVMML
nr:NADH dehydrogenase subunit 2 [Baetis sp. PC-2010]